MMNKADAEREHGFRLYQGGIVPGNELRVVDIAGIDTEACCGTHCDNTAEVGWIRIIKSQRISDGIVRLYYVAHERAIEIMNKETDIINQLGELWGIDQTQILPTATRFLNDYKKLSAQTKKQDQSILELQMKCVLNDENKLFYVKSDQPDPTLYFSFLARYAQEVQQKEKAVVFIGSTFVIGLLAKPDMVDFAALEEEIKKQSKANVKAQKKDNVKFDPKKKGVKPGWQARVRQRP